MSINPSANPLAFFAGEVKRLRAKIGMTQEQLGAAINYSPSTIAALETCRLLPSVDLARALDKVFGTDGHSDHSDHFERLQALVEETCVLPWFRERIEVEREAREICEYEPHMIPGLLQTEAYMRAVLKARRPILSPEQMKQAVNSGPSFTSKMCGAPATAKVKTK